jgi:hypothetical protein
MSIVTGVAQSAIGALQNSPMLLFMMLFNVLTFVGLGYILLTVGNHRATEFKVYSDAGTRREVALEHALDQRYGDIINLCFQRLNVERAKEEEHKDAH